MQVINDWLDRPLFQVDGLVVTVAVLVIVGLVVLYVLKK